MKRFSILLFFIIGLIIPFGSFAQTEQKIYSYESIDATITVNPDTSFSVEERQVFDYRQGVFHQGWRSIPLTKLGRITGVAVIDGTTGQSLQYSLRRLDKNDPNNWGKYTVYTERGNFNIEWYYNLSNTKKPWVLRYTVHGGLEFYKENDRLYWNIFSDYMVPVGTTTARVVFPVGANSSAMQFDAYRTSGAPILKTVQTDGSIYFETIGVAPQEAFTIDIAFPKGVVQEAAFWKEWLTANYGLVGSAIVVLLGILFMVGYWYRTERYRKGRGVIIPQYEPPKALRPAMAEVVVNESISQRTWPATIVDLAVRGYVIITEETPNKFAKFGNAFATVVLAIIVGSVVAASIGLRNSGGKIFSLAIPLIILVLFIISACKKRGGKLSQLFIAKSYAVEKAKEYKDDPQVEEYERKFLDILFSRGDIFSLQAIKRDPSAQREFATKVAALKNALYEEVDIDVPVFENGMRKGKYVGYVLIGIFMIGFMLFNIGSIVVEAQAFLLAMVTIAMTAVIIVFIKFEPRLSHEGHLLKEDWLGFKLYLETAERYRMQNLTPDIFEKYLPYAMIFGIEKQWAKTFEGMHMQPPSWYGASHVGMAAGISSGSSFSPVGFSSGFSSSFASAFASSGGGGGGGGSAGGGGGGGGGGAS